MVKVKAYSFFKDATSSFHCFPFLLSMTA
jgi:hypothetical protein